MGLSEHEHIRKRPGMYIGCTTLRGLHHLAAELIGKNTDDHGVDESTFEVSPTSTTWKVCGSVVLEFHDSLKEP